MNNSKPKTDHAAYMRRAIALARRGQGRVEPNPMVGCVIVNKGRIVGEGYHRRYGKSHAEPNALAQAGRLARSSAAYVTLEPCNHFGKTPPCTLALIEAGVDVVHAAIEDPNPQVSGRGIRALRKAGIRVHVGLLQKDARELNSPYFKRIKHGLPYVIAKWAQSIDGKIATRQGHSQWISGEASRKYVHRLRSRMDAIMVGIQTVLTDNPMLTCRGIPVKRIAHRVILDTHLRIPIRSKILTTAHEIPTWVCTSLRSADSPRAAKLRSLGAQILGTRLRRNKPDLQVILKHLASEGISNILIEGGGSILGSAFDQQLVDECYAFVSPTIIGGHQAPTSVMGVGVQRVDQACRWKDFSTRRIGADILLHGRL